MNFSCTNQEACPVILDSKCVIYEGENLLYIGVNTNDNYRVALEKINNTIANLVLTGAGITQLIGDVAATGPGIASATLATVNSTPGQFGSSTAIPKLTVDGKGRITAITTEAVFIPSGALSFIGDVTGTGNTGSDTTLTLSTVNSNVYTTNNFLKFAVNAKGLITSATPVGSSDIITALGYTPQVAGNYITELTGEASASGPGVANIILNNAAVTAKVLTGVNITGGSINASDSILTAFGKIQNQINSLIGGSIYQGTWNAATNTPTLTSGVGTKGYYYIVNTPGSTNLDGITDWGLGDWAIFDGTAWQQVDNTDAVVSVNGFTGAVSLTTDNISEGLTNQYYTNTRARLALGITTTGSSGPATYDNTTGIFNIPDYSSALTGYVPYTGATADVNLGTYGLLADYLQLNVLPTSVPTTPGVMSWNDDAGTMDIRLKRGNVSLQVGQETVVPIINKTGINLLESNYQIVRVRTAAEGGAQGQRLAVKLALADNDANSATTLGVVTENINDNQEGFITVFGNVSEINTTGSLQGETWVDGDMLFLSPTVPGALTNVKPIAPQHLVIIGYVVYAHAQHGKIFVKVDNGYELEELHNVYAPEASKVNNQVLTWDATGSVWTNKSITDILGYTPANDSLVVHLAGSETITGNKTFSGVLSTTASSFIGAVMHFSQSAVYYPSSGYTSLLGIASGLKLGFGGANTSSLLFPATTQSYTFPNADGTIALTSDIPSLTGYIQGSGTTNYIPKFTASGTIGDSSINEVGGNVGIGMAPTTDRLTINGTATVFGNVNISSYLNLTGLYGGYISSYNGASLTQMNYSGSQHFWYAGGFTQMVLLGSGNLGLGTNSPISKIDLNDGNIRMGEFLNSTSSFIGKQRALNSVFYSSVEFYSSTTEDMIIFNTHLSGVSSGERLRITGGGTVQPGANGTQDLGSTSLRWATVYTSDLDMSNGIGDYTIVEGREDLFLYNNITNKVFKFALIEVDPSEATPKLKK